MGEDVFADLRVKIAELATELKNMAHDMRNAVLEMKSFATSRDVDRAQDVMAQRLAAQEKAHGDRLTALENIVTWAGRLIVGAVLLALLGLVLKANGGKLL